MKNQIKRISRAFAFGAYALVCGIIILEIFFRNYWIDFYRPELIALNEGLNLKKSNQENILVIGDSFTAHPESYVKWVRQKFPGCQIINAGIPGTTIRQNMLPLKKRVKKFKPELIIYQIYLGNDLFEFRHPIAGYQIPAVRKIYWWCSDRLRILGLINYRSLSIRTAIYDDLGPPDMNARDNVFNPSKYTPRTKMHIRAEPDHLEQVMRVEGVRKKDVDQYLDELFEACRSISSDIPVILLPLPHSAQVNARYEDHLRQLGGIFDHGPMVSQEDYPFLAALKAKIKPLEHVMVANPLLPLRMADQHQKIFYDNDPHLSPYGQRALGDFLTSYLQNEIAFAAQCIPR